MRDLGNSIVSLSGSLLVAHPCLVESNFCRTVVLLANHSAENGALGVVINRGLGESLGDYGDEYADTPLARVPLFYGGPCDTERILLLAWKWNEHSRDFKLYFGITSDKAAEMMNGEPGLEVRGFLGYSGWQAGQLEKELMQDSWSISPIESSTLSQNKGVQLWRALLRKTRPGLSFLADAPDDPSSN